MMIFRPVLFVCLAPWALALAETPVPPVKDVAAPAKRDRVSVSADTSIFPARWLKPDIAASAEPIAPAEAARARADVAAALALYPEALLDAELGAVHLVGRLGYSGIFAGGANSLRDVYIAVRTPREGYTDRHIRECFHHEFSSILLRNHPAYLDLAAWKAAQDDKGSDSPGNGVESVRRGLVKTGLDPASCEKGFLSVYSRASVEEDFNVFAQNLLGGEKALWDAAAKYPRIAVKLRLMIAFYSRLDPKFDETFFRKLAGFPAVATKPAETKTTPAEQVPPASR